eukprot:TRINITY_DN29266_c0_g1_i1.p1 TRINITY_DN29266_c0_g1~~TRINITY_DN29266_c0_g1_i1.p1  ORF type:complete len:776 (-),score=119.25 TRINITY_DN29266_c0_g1_i1:144-2471(-)
MQSWIVTVLASISSILLPALILPVVAGLHEHHAGHKAVHATELVRRASTANGKIHRRTSLRKRPHEDQMKAAAISAHADTEALHRFGDDRLGQKRRQRNLEWERIVNLTTELQDMKSEYTGLIGVGTTREGKAQFQARVVFDTGSTNLWVASVLCQQSPCDNGKGDLFYNPSKSVTEESYTGGRSGDIDIMFGTGELKGPLHVDTYRVGPMVVKQQPFAMIREMTGDVFSSFQFEGILGLAFKSLSFGGITPFFERVIEQKLLKNNEFAFYLNADSDQPSALLWGGVDRDLYEGPITMFPVVQLHYWAVELVEFKIGSKSLGGTRHKNSNLRKLIIDSGTTYFTAPSDLYSQVVSRMPEAACADVEDYKPLTYVLRGKNGDTFELIVTQETYMIGSSGDEGSCRPAFMALDVSEKYGPALILGEVFMRHFFTVFSRGDGNPNQARVGFAAAKIGAVPKVSSRPDGKGTDGTVLVESGPAPDKPKERIVKEVLKPCAAGSDVDCMDGASLTEKQAEKSDDQVFVDSLRAAPTHGVHSKDVGQAASFLETPKGAPRYVHQKRAEQAQHGLDAVPASALEDSTSAEAAATPISEKEMQSSLAKIRQLDSESSFASKLEEVLRPGSHTEDELVAAGARHSRETRHWHERKEGHATPGGLSESVSVARDADSELNSEPKVSDMARRLADARKVATTPGLQPSLSAQQTEAMSSRWHGGQSRDEDDNDHEVAEDDEEDARRARSPFKELVKTPLPVAAESSIARLGSEHPERSLMRRQGSP